MRKSYKILNSSSEMFNVFKWKQLVQTKLKILNLNYRFREKKENKIFFPLSWYDNNSAFKTMFNSRSSMKMLFFH